MGSSQRPMRPNAESRIANFLPRWLGASSLSSIGDCIVRLIPGKTNTLWLSIGLRAARSLMILRYIFWACPTPPPNRLPCRFPAVTTLRRQNDSALLRNRHRKNCMSWAHLRPVRLMAIPYEHIAPSARCATCFAVRRRQICRCSRPHFVLILHRRIEVCRSCRFLLMNWVFRQRSAGSWRCCCESCSHEIADPVWSLELRTRPAWHAIIVRTVRMRRF